MSAMMIFRLRMMFAHKDVNVCLLLLQLCDVSKATRIFLLYYYILFVFACYFVCCYYNHNYCIKLSKNQAQCKDVVILLLFPLKLPLYTPCNVFGLSRVYVFKLILRTHFGLAEHHSFVGAYWLSSIFNYFVRSRRRKQSKENRTYAVYKRVVRLTNLGYE